jgi:hypothetical protein
MRRFASDDARKKKKQGENMNIAATNENYTPATALRLNPSSGDFLNGKAQAPFSWPLGITPYDVLVLQRQLQDRLCI